MTSDDIDHDFDFDRVYYRVIGTRPGYMYNQGEPEQIADGAGLVTHDRPYFEFESLAGVGTWMHLGARIRRLRIPRDAVVVRNRPYSQGGCYAWSADRVELLDTLDHAALIREMVDTGTEPHALDLEDLEIPADFRLPIAVGLLFIRDCLACEPLTLPERAYRLDIRDSALRVARFPTELEHFDAHDSLFEDVDGPPPARWSHVERCTFVRRTRR